MVSEDDSGGGEDDNAARLRMIQISGVVAIDYLENTKNITLKT